jgi:hypothetical protein
MALSSLPELLAGAPWRGIFAGILVATHHIPEDPEKKVLAQLTPVSTSGWAGCARATPGG